MNSFRASQSKWVDRLIPFAILLGHAVALGREAAWAWRHHETGVDGALFLEVAMNVRDRLGPVSFVASSHLGAPNFPVPAMLAPGWPVLLGLSARLFDVEVLAHGLPWAFSLLAVVFAFHYGSSANTRGRTSISALGLSLHPGYLLALPWMVVPGLRQASVTPLPMALAALATFAMAIRSRALVGKCGWLSGAELGIWCGAIFLVQPWFLGLALLVLGWELVRVRPALRASASLAAAFVCAFAFCSLPSLVRLSRFSLDSPLKAYLFPAEMQMTRWLPRGNGAGTAWDGDRPAAVRASIPTLGEALPRIVGFWPLVVTPGTGRLLAPWARGVAFHELEKGDGADVIVCLREKLLGRFALLAPDEWKSPELRRILNLRGTDDEVAALGRALPEGWWLFEIPPGSEPCKGWDGRDGRREAQQGE